MQRTLLAASLCALMIASIAVPAVPETRKAFCSVCMDIVNAIETPIENREPDILKHCENLCDDLLGDQGNLAQDCKHWIDTDFGQIMDKLTIGSLSPNAICKDYHMC